MSQSSGQTLGLLITSTSVVIMATASHLNREWAVVAAAVVYLVGAYLVAFGDQHLSGGEVSER